MLLHVLLRQLNANGEDTDGKYDAREFERDLIRERTNAGLAAAKARGRVGGRPRKLNTNKKIALARQMFANQSHSIPEICETLEISRATLYRYVKENLPT